MGILSDHFRGIDECDKLKIDSFDGLFARKTAQENGYVYVDTEDGKDIYVKKEIVKNVFSD